MDEKNAGRKQGHEIQGPVREGCSFKESGQGSLPHYDNDFGGRVWRSGGISDASWGLVLGRRKEKGSHGELRAAFLRAAQRAGPEARERLNVERKSVPNTSDWLRLRVSPRGKY